MEVLELPIYEDLERVMMKTIYDCLGEWGKKPTHLCLNPTAFLQLKHIMRSRQMIQTPEEAYSYNGVPLVCVDMVAKVKAGLPPDVVATHIYKQNQMIDGDKKPEGGA